MDSSSHEHEAPALAPYRVEDSNRTLTEVLTQTNRIVYDCHGPDLATARQRIVAGPLFHYERLLDDLQRLPRLRFVPLRRLCRTPIPADEIWCCLRHDVDIDARTALAMAALEHARDIVSSYYILPTAAYYGAWREQVFLRHGAMAHAYRTLQALGHEVGLHTDALALYQQHRIDGAEGLVAELAWLRGQGLEIDGSLAHNSAAVYGAENFEIFKGRPRLPGKAGRRNEVVHQGRWAPLQVLDEAALGLVYEGNEVFGRADIPMVYAATRAADTWRLSDNRPQALRPASERDQPRARFTVQDDLLHRIRSVRPGECLMLVVHPVYYGLRHNRTAGPVRALQRSAVETSPRLGWSTYVPRSLQAHDGRYTDASGVTVKEFQSIQVANAWGMLDYPTMQEDDAGALRILLLGGRNPDGATVAPPCQIASHLQEQLARTWERPVRVVKLCHPGIGFTRAYGWYRAVADTLRPAFVLLGLGADEPAASLPAAWRTREGIDPDRPPGLYLRAGPDGSVTVVPRAQGAAFFRRAVGPMSAPPPSLAGTDARPGGTATIDALAACLGHFACEIRAAGARPFAFVQECGESIGLWSPGTSVAETRAGHQRTLSVLETITRRAGVALADPYPLFFDRGDAPAAHWRGNAEWSSIGHQLAAGVLADALGPTIGAEAVA